MQREVALNCYLPRFHISFYLYEVYYLLVTERCFSLTQRDC